jgi:hypothetical protein
MPWGFLLWRNRQFANHESALRESNPIAQSHWLTHGVTVRHKPTRLLNPIGQSLCRAEQRAAHLPAPLEKQGSISYKQ